MALYMCQVFHAVDFFGSIEVLLRQSQSDEPSDLCTSHECIKHRGVPGGHPSNYEPGATLLNFSDQAQTCLYYTSSNGNG